jgi:acyl-CoA synthetase (AMP-forming)/AMP-acid ligase II
MPAETVAALCRDMASAHGQNLALADGTTRLDFATLNTRTDRLANALRQRGVATGDRVAALLLDGNALLELYFAAAKRGAILVPLNWRLAPAELAYILHDSAPALLFVDESFVPLVAETGLKLVAVTDNNAGTGEYAQFLESGAATELPAPAPDAPWLMLYTSGTTGRPKGCLLTQTGQMASTSASLVYWGVGQEDRLLIALPLFHVGGLGILLTHFAAGAASIICRRHLATPALLDLAVAESCRSLCVSPTLLPEIIALQRTAPRNLTISRVTMGGGMHETALVREVRDVLGTEILAGYGQTEAGNFVCYLNATEQLKRPTACGRPLRHIQASIQDADGTPVPPGEVGELCLRGPSIMSGYWRNPTATAATLRNGWLRSGDMMRLDADGFLHFVSRSKELIKSGGENVYPREVELVLLAHPGVADACVFGVPDETWGEAVKAAIVPNPTNPPDPAALVAWCRQHIAGYKRPRYIEFMASLPRSPLGKLATQDLRARPVTPEQRTG